MQTFELLSHKHNSPSVFYLLAQGATTLSLHRLIQQNGAKKSVCHCVMREMRILTCHMVTYTLHTPTYTRPSHFVTLQPLSFPKQVFFV